MSQCLTISGSSNEYDGLLPVLRAVLFVAYRGCGSGF
uniref:Uncharacterized protein n=1 Tax=Anguilla anguilla TaxID=7936 RepID=A0A0E9UHS8_ANGAN